MSANHVPRLISSLDRGLDILRHMLDEGRSDDFAAAVIRWEDLLLRLEAVYAVESDARGHALAQRAEKEAKDDG